MHLKFDFGLDAEMLMHLTASCYAWYGMVEVCVLAPHTHGQSGTLTASLRLLARTVKMKKEARRVD